MLRVALASLVALLVLPGPDARPASSRQPVKLIGVVENPASESSPNAPTARAQLVADNNFNASRHVVYWRPGQSVPNSTDLADVGASFEASVLTGGSEVMLTIIPDPESCYSMQDNQDTQRQFAQYVASWVTSEPQLKYVEIGNEPNSNTFCPAQFTTDAEPVPIGARIYVSLLARAYDSAKTAALKRGLPVVVIGGALASTGSDDPWAAKASRSPVAFIGDMGVALWASGRTRPIFDAFSHHPYGRTNTDPPWRSHDGGTIGFADYPKLRATMKAAFRGTGQSARVPVLYSEYGVQTCIPRRERASYTGVETVQCVSEKVQARFYRAAIRITICQKNVMGLQFFKWFDEPKRSRWQSGLYYTDESSPTPKSSLRMVRKAAGSAGNGTTKCG